MFFICIGLALSGFCLLMAEAVFPLDLAHPEHIGWFYIRLLAPLGMMMTGLLLADRIGKNGQLARIRTENEKDAPQMEGIPGKHSESFLNIRSRPNHRDSSCNP